MPNACSLPESIAACLATTMCSIGIALDCSIPWLLSNGCGIKSAGAGRNLVQASAPAVLEIEGKGRVIVFSFASVTSGVPRNWAATPKAAGVNLLPDFSEATVGRIADQVAHVKQPGDVIIASIHWGPNWGYEIPEEHRSFAHALIDQAHVSVVHGHSSHHPKAIEIYKNQLILYGCGDFLNDYEGIRGYEEFRGDLTLMYFAGFNSLTGHLIDLELVPLQMRRFQLVPASDCRYFMVAANTRPRERAGSVRTSD